MSSGWCAEMKKGGGEHGNFAAYIERGQHIGRR